MKETLKKIWHLLFGYKYYLCVVHRVGTDIYEVNSIMFKTKAEVKDYKIRLYQNRTFEHVETISFRSRLDYVNVR